MPLYKDFTQKLQQYLQEHNNMIPGIIEIPTGNREFLKEVPESSGLKNEKQKQLYLNSGQIYRA